MEPGVGTVVPKCISCTSSTSIACKLVENAEMQQPTPLTASEVLEVDSSRLSLTALFHGTV